MKRVISIIAGIITGFIIVFIGDATAHALYPAPPDINMMDKSSLAHYLTEVPVYVMVIMIMFWLLSSFLGGMLAARINRMHWKRTAIITGAILMAAAILNMIIVPGHPGWMWIAVLVGYIPSALLGGWLVRPKVIQP